MLALLLRPVSLYIIGAISFFLLYIGYSTGNEYGRNARLYRAVLAELAKKNVELADLKAKDATETAEEDAARDAAHSTAIKALGVGPKATKAQADLLNSIGE